MQSKEAANRLYDYNTELTNETRGDIAEMIVSLAVMYSDHCEVTDKYINECHQLRNEVLNLKTALNVYRNLS